MNKSNESQKFEFEVVITRMDGSYASFGGAESYFRTSLIDDAVEKYFEFKKIYDDSISKLQAVEINLLHGHLTEDSLPVKLKKEGGGMLMYSQCYSYATL